MQTLSNRCRSSLSRVKTVERFSKTGCDLRPRMAKGHLVWSVACGLLLLFDFSEPSHAVECSAFVRMHGFLRAAANQCTFTQYNPEIIETARQCYERLGSVTAAPLMFAGRDEFERMMELRGQYRMCTDIGLKFPMVVR
jgi:hypothetical protein